MSREEELRLIDAEIALCETKLKILQVRVDREWGMRFGVLLGQKLFLLENYAECRTCKRRHMFPDVCLESRWKTDKCILDVGIEQLERLPWKTEGL
jgi:hypothetical protein